MRPVAAILAIALLGGCAAQLGRDGRSGAASGYDIANEAKLSAQLQSRIDTSSDYPATNLWARVVEGFALEPAAERPAVRQWIQFYAGHEDHLLDSAQRARPFLWHIVEALEAHDMPMELALLPIVESGFNPTALSHASATGLWQFMPDTARRFGLDRNWWYDARRDVLASTGAALDYLAWLHGQFGDWQLALAAYNAGEGRVSRAIARNERRGMPTDFWHLNLPKETENYVPKLLALREILIEPDQYALEWPFLANQPLTASVELPAQVELSRAAEMIDLPIEELRTINPGYRRWATHPNGTQSLLVPIERAEKLRTQLAQADPKSLMSWGRHRVSRGEALSTIARRYGTSVATLRDINELRSTTIRAGDYLLIPRSAERTSPALQANAEQARQHRVRSGESLWSIAHRYNVSVARLRAWNNLEGDSTLHPGQKLTIHGGSAPAQARVYRVRRGDSLWSIARRLDVHVQDIRRWNNLARNAVLRPGQKLEIHGSAAEQLVYYQVRDGDSLWSIATRFSVDVSDLRDWNDLDNAGYIRPGQKLRILVDATS